MDTSLFYSACRVPAGRSGEWIVEKITIPQRDYDPGADPRPEAFKFRPGVYTSLRRGSVQFMTDLYDELWTQRRAIFEARKRGGDILITGLGLGLVAEAILESDLPARTRITVVEYAADVIRLVGPSLMERFGEHLEIIQGDALIWLPEAGRRFSVGWHDIWPDPYDERAQDEARALEARFSPYCDWQGSWPAEYLRAFSDDALEEPASGG